MNMRENVKKNRVGRKCLQPEDVCIILPAANEAMTIAKCIGDVVRVFPKAEIIVVAGGDDATEQIAREIAAENSHILVVRQKGRGKGGAILEAMSLTKARTIAQFDTDAQFLAEDLARAVDVIQNREADLCIGSRFMTPQASSRSSNGLARYWGNQWLSGWVSMLVGHKCSDVTSGLKVWRQESMPRNLFRETGYCYELEIIVRAVRAGAKLTELPVQEMPRRFGVSMHGGIVSLCMAGIRLGVHALRCRLEKMDRGAKITGTALAGLDERWLAEVEEGNLNLARVGVNGRGRT